MHPLIASDSRTFPTFSLSRCVMPMYSPGRCGWDQPTAEWSNVGPTDLITSRFWDSGQASGDMWRLMPAERCKRVTMAGCGQTDLGPRQARYGPSTPLLSASVRCGTTNPSRLAQEESDPSATSATTHWRRCLVWWRRRSWVGGPMLGVNSVEGLHLKRSSPREW